MWMCWIAAGGAPGCPFEVPSHWPREPRRASRAEGESSRGCSTDDGGGEAGLSDSRVAQPQRLEPHGHEDPTR